ncbi:MAG: solute carrier family 23 protein [Clostridium sp.]
MAEVKDQREVKLIADVDDKIPVSQSIFLGIQHVLAMDIYIVPIILAGALAMGIGEKSFLIQMTFMAAGIATIIQATIGLKLPVMQGPSYIPIGALAAIGGKLGLATMVGSMIPGAILIAVLGYFKLLGKIMKKIIPPIVAGTVILVIGIALMPVAITNLYHGDKPIDNIIVAGVSAVLLVIFLIIGARANGKFKFFKLCSVIIALVGGTIVAAMYEMVNFAPVADAAWFALPKLMPFGMPEFDLNSVLVMIFIYFVILIESTGTWFAIGSVTGKEIDEKKIDGGSAGEGLGCAIGSVLGSMPVTGYSTNAGIIAITGVASRRAIIAGGGILIALGLMPKFTTLIGCIPEVVIMGVFAIVTVIIAMNGFRVLKSVSLNERNMLVIGIPVLLTIACVVTPKEVVGMMPVLLQYLINAGMALGAVAAVVLNIVLPKENDEVIVDNASNTHGA